MGENSNSDKNYHIPSSSSETNYTLFMYGMVIVPGGEGNHGQLIFIESVTPDRSDRPERYHHVIAYRKCMYV